MDSQARNPVHVWPVGPLLPRKPYGPPGLDGADGTGPRAHRTRRRATRGLSLQIGESFLCLRPSGGPVSGPWPWLPHGSYTNMALGQGCHVGLTPTRHRGHGCHIGLTPTRAQGHGCHTGLTPTKGTRPRMPYRSYTNGGDKEKQKEREGRWRPRAERKHRGWRTPRGGGGGRRPKQHATCTPLPRLAAKQQCDSVQAM